MTNRYRGWAVAALASLALVMALGAMGCRGAAAPQPDGPHASPPPAGADAKQSGSAAADPNPPLARSGDEPFGAHESASPAPNPREGETRSAARASSSGTKTMPFSGLTFSTVKRSEVEAALVELGCTEVRSTPLLDSLHFHVTRDGAGLSILVARRASAVQSEERARLLASGAVREEPSLFVAIEGNQPKARALLDALFGQPSTPRPD